MSRASTARNATEPATVFAALGDTTRLELVSRLGDGRPRSITQLADGLNLTRQAVTKHLNTLKRAGIVTSRRSGRESHFAIRPESIKAASDYLNRASEQWDEAIERLKRVVEE